MKKICLALALSLALAGTALGAATSNSLESTSSATVSPRNNTTTPTGTKAQCDHLCDAFITGQELLGRLRGCHTQACNAQRADIDHVLSEIAATFRKLHCPRVEGVIGYMTPEHDHRIA